jgi:hypothetical protein
MGEWQGIGNVSTVSDRATAPAKGGGFDRLTLGCAFLTFLLTVELVRQRISGGSSFEPPALDVAGYGVPAAIVAIQVGLLVRALVRRRGGLLIIASLALVLALGAVLFLARPRIDWPPDPPAATLSPDYVPCYSGSGDCIGG